MAKLKVKSGDSLVSISNKNKIPLEDLQAANPGVSTLKPGQAIKVPNKIENNKPNTGYVDPRLQAGRGTNANFGSPDPRLSAGRSQNANFGQQGYTGTAGYWGAYNQPISDPRLQAGRGTNANFGSGVTNPTSGYTGTAGYWGTYNAPKDPRLQAGRGTNANYGGQQPYLGSSGYLNPAYQTPQNTQPTNVPTASTVKLTNPRPVNPDGSTPQYTGDPNDPNTAKWKAYWNNVAQLGGDPNIPPAAPTVMTREEIWQMKAASRRRKIAGMSSDEFGGGGGGGSYAPYQYSETNQSFVAEPLVRSITWGI